MKKILEFVLNNILWGFVMLSIQDILDNTPTVRSIIIWSSFILLNTYLILSYFLKQKYFAFPFTGKLFSIFHINNPDLFKYLDETELKDKIADAVGFYSFKEDIKRVYLLRGREVFKYQIVVIGTDNDRYYGLTRYWERLSKEDIFKSDFREVYKEKPIDKSFWVDWGIGVVLSLDEFPDELIDKKRKWILY